jgi:hypothetical protein
MLYTSRGQPSEDWSYNYSSHKYERWGEVDGRIGIIEVRDKITQAPQEQVSTPEPVRVKHLKVARS